MIERTSIHVWVAIVAIPILNFAAPVFPVIGENMTTIGFIACLVLAGLSMIAKSRFDTLLALAIAAGFGGARYYFSDVDERTLALRVAAIAAFLILNLVLLIGPWSRLSNFVLRQYGNRRHLGVAAFLLAQLHFSLVFTNYFQASFANAFMALFTFFGFTAYFIMFFLAVTSWDYLQKHVSLPKWKWVHLGAFIVYALVAGYAVYINLSNGLQVESWQWGALVTFLILWFFMAPWGIAPRIIKWVNGWKQLHTLVHIAYLSVVLHAWFGVVEAQPFWVQFAFLFIVGLVWVSHAFGWYLKWKQDRDLKSAQSSATRMEIDGESYQSAGPVDAWKEGKARRVLVENRPIAIFKYRDRFFGLSAICAHQKGPIDRGEIVNGYVECPWHRWQYSCEDGQAPSGFKDRIPFYRCIVKDGVVFVALRPKHAGG